MSDLFLPKCSDGNENLMMICKEIMVVKWCVIGQSGWFNFVAKQFYNQIILTRDFEFSTVCLNTWNLFFRHYALSGCLYRYINQWAPSFVRLNSEAKNTCRWESTFQRYIVGRETCHVQIYSFSTWFKTMTIKIYFKFYPSRQSSK